MEMGKPVALRVMSMCTSRLSDIVRVFLFQVCSTVLWYKPWMDRIELEITNILIQCLATKAILI